MTEPDVTLTDYLVALEALVFLALFARQPRGSDGSRQWFMVFFGALSAATFLGGTVHGFFVDEASLGHATLWRATMLAVGVTTLSLWALGAKLLFSKSISRWVVIVAGVQFAAYTLCVLFVTQEFGVAVLNYLPSVLFLLVALGAAYWRLGYPSLLLAAAGLSLTVFASVLQQSQIDIHAVYFNHNAVYHVFQAVALLLLFLCGRQLIADDQSRSTAKSSEFEASAGGAQVRDL